ncbi:AAA family ATPase [Nonomuraea sp. NPDC049129]|uniref:AAA family ATPase n=1 Tax=Nonomuraea sp. NPDC049129 TaxID=3155272 RepID=UPI0033F516F1
MIAERDVQLARLTRLLGECRESQGATAVIRGPLAVGKTTLLRLVTERAAAAGALVLDAVGSCAERDLSLGVLRQLFHGLDGAEHLLSEPDLNDACDPTLSPRGRLSSLANRQLWTAVRARSEQVPVVLAIDDLHYADKASLHTLGYFSSRVRGARVLIVATGAETPAAIDRLQGLWHTDLLRQPEFHSIRVAKLSGGGVAEVIADRKTPGAAERLAHHWHRLSGGNPLLLMAMLEDEQTTSDAVGPEYGKAVVACLRRGGRHVLDVARGLAALGDHASPARLSRLLGVPESAILQLLETLEAAGLVTDGRFPHPAAAQALLADFPIAEREELHRAAASLLHHVGAPPEQVARHLVETWYAGEDWAFDVLAAAAREALRRDELEFATNCLDLAELACAEAEIEEEKERRLTLLALRVCVEFRDNPAAIHRLEPLTWALKEGRLRNELAAAIVPALLWQGHQDAIVSAFWQPEAAEAVAPARTALKARHRPFAPLLTLPGCTTLEGTTTLETVLHEGPSEEATRSAERVLESLSLDDATFCSIQSALLALLYSEHADLAAQRCDELLSEASARRAASWQALLTATQAEISIRFGDMRAAQRHARAALALVPERRWGETIGLPWSSRVIATTAMSGDDPEAEPVTLPDAMYRSRFGAQYLYARGQRHLALDHLHAAYDELTVCGNLLQERGIDLPAFLPWRSDAVRALLRLGQQKQARDLAAEQFIRPGADRPRTRGISLRALAATAEPPERPELLEEAIDLLETAGDRAQLGYALAELSEARHRLGQSGKARMAARRAEHLAAECSLAPLTRSLAGGGRPIPADPAQPRYSVFNKRGLSTAECRVAELAAAGRTNREISAVLFVTVSTVEQHLTRVYRKLCVSGRADLLAFSAEVRRSG